MLNFNEIYKFYYEWWKNIDKTLFLLIIFLFGLGLFFSLVSTSLIASDKLDTNNYFFFFKHLIFILLGMGVLIFFSSLSEKNLFKISLYLFFILFPYIFLSFLLSSIHFYPFLLLYQKIGTVINQLLMSFYHHSFLVRI